MKDSSEKKANVETPLIFSSKWYNNSINESPDPILAREEKDWELYYTACDVLKRKISEENTDLGDSVLYIRQSSSDPRCLTVVEIVGKRIHVNKEEVTLMQDLFHENKIEILRSKLTDASFFSNSILSRKGCDLYLMSELPGSNDEKYRNTYIFIETKSTPKLFYIKEDGQKEQVKIDDTKKFKESLAEIMKNNKQQHLSAQQVYDLITLNGGHTTTKGLKNAKILLRGADMASSTSYKLIFVDHIRFALCKDTTGKYGWKNVTNYKQVKMNNWEIQDTKDINNQLDQEEVIKSLWEAIHEVIPEPYRSEEHWFRPTEENAERLYFKQYSQKNYNKFCSSSTTQEKEKQKITFDLFTLPSEQKNSENNEEKKTNDNKEKKSNSGTKYTSCFTQ